MGVALLYTMTHAIREASYRVGPPLAGGLGWPYSIRPLHKRHDRIAYSRATPCGWPVAHGLWPVAHGLWPVAHGLWPVAHGLWPVAPGLWPVAHGLWPVAHGLWLCCAPVTRFDPSRGYSAGLRMASTFWKVW